MSAVAAAVIGSAVIGGVVSSSAASKAGRAQVQAADRSAEEQRAAREEMRTLLNPYVSAGTPALQAQMAALGLSGPEAQQAYVAEQEQSPIFQALARQQEEAILQNASATGGLRGGNVQGALAQFRPALLNQFLEQQYGRL
jgi:saccharopine dehydrogenase-like NADP-dependent oxidoreductase